MANPQIKLLDFKVKDRYTLGYKSYDEDPNGFVIQMFGLDENQKNYSIFVEDFEPFFYIKIDKEWDEKILENYKKYLIKKLAQLRIKELTKNNKLDLATDPKAQTYYDNSITQIEIVKKHKLYGFDNHKKHNYIRICFKNLNIYNKIKNMFYDIDYKPFYKKVLKNGENKVTFQDTELELYEAKIPPLLKFFHILSQQNCIHYLNLLRSCRNFFPAIHQN